MLIFSLNLLFLIKSMKLNLSYFQEFKLFYFLMHKLFMNFNRFLKVFIKLFFNNLII